MCGNAKNNSIVRGDFVILKSGSFIIQWQCFFFYLNPSSFGGGIPGGLVHIAS